MVRSGITLFAAIIACINSWPIWSALLRGASSQMPPPRPPGAPAEVPRGPLPSRSVAEYVFSFFLFLVLYCANDVYVIHRPLREAGHVEDTLRTL